MRTPRLAGLGLAVATAAFAVAGCSTDGTAEPATSTSAAGPSTGTGPAPSSSAADPEAVKALSNATAALGTTSFKLTTTAGAGFKLTAAIDAPNSKGTADISATGANTDLTVKSLLIGQDLYAQIPGITKDATWTHLDMSRLPDGANVGLRPGRIDPVATADLLGSSTDVHAAGVREYAGTVDLTSVTNVAGLDSVTIDGYGPAAQRVPFTAGLDDQGRLSVLTLRLPAVEGRQAEPIEALYTGYGDPVTAERPAASAIVEAPENVYTALGG
ncbi:MULTISPECIES: hypothetical protein [Actinoplanes]|uniref:hypothetical protein n=1 Tax=Actinoplanes TaxID=1865 RepID=UPI0005F2857D|nr:MULTISPECIES: hypothetical protein [Actinoplanes]GLY03530.1 hypothetical protein Acsp01_39090 [Actinoplanes sp. NBRC 101535]